MWTILQRVLPWLLLILFISQIAVPLLFDTPTFWLFKRGAFKTKKPIEDELHANLEKVEEVVEQVKGQVKDVQDKAKENLKTAEDIKRKSDGLL